MTSIALKASRCSAKRAGAEKNEAAAPSQVAAHGRPIYGPAVERHWGVAKR